MKFEWKPMIDCEYESTSYAKVFGGWVVHHICWDNAAHIQSESMVFIPDKNHEWEIEK